MEARLFDGQVLQAVDLLDIDEPEDGTDLALDDQVIWLFAGQKRHDDAGGLVHLSDFLFDGHLLEQFFSAAVGFRLCHGRGLSGETPGYGNYEKAD